MKSIRTSLFFSALIFTITLTGISCSQPKPTVENKKIGVQIYSVRNELNNDMQGTIDSLASIGYTYIESYGMLPDGTILGMPSAEFSQMITDAGMELVSSHSTYFTANEAPAMIESAKAAGIDYVIIPFLGGDQRGDYDAIAQNLDEVGAMFKEAGIGFGYHNHDFEFQPTEDGRIPMEILIEGTDPGNVSFQADLYWITKAGLDAVEFVNKYPGRFISFHVKDSDADLNQTTVGTGIVDFKSILSTMDVSGAEYYFVEDERTDAPLLNLKGAHDNLQIMDF